MLDGLFFAPSATAIAEALAAAHATLGPIAVVGSAKLATALASQREVIPITGAARAPKTLPTARNDLTSIEPRSLAAVIGVDITADVHWPETLRIWSRAVRDGGAIIFVDKGHASEAARRALCAGLSELEQRHAGRTVITSGLVSHLT